MFRKCLFMVTVMVCTAAAAQQTTTVPAANTPAPKAVGKRKVVDHYKFWKVTSVPLVEVQLLGQFDKGVWWDASVDSLELLGNPTQKTHRGTTTTISDSSLHLTVYSITPAKAQPQRNVTLANQFTNRITGGPVTEVWKVGDPELLLVPAGKKIGATAAKPGSGDHFACYAVIDPVRFAEPMTLEDQFDVRRGKVEEITELEPAYFCVPVQKRYGKVPEQPLLDANTHLAVYKILPRDRLMGRGQLWVHTADQFGSRRLRVTASRMIAVPTTKVNWGDGLIFEERR